MSGWIQLDKDLREDVRVQRMARALVTRGDVTHMRYTMRAAVTLVLGGLAQLWMHADAFARDDDTLEITAEEIDELTGIEGFAQLLPSDWLKILDPQRVELPGFQAHNGTTAKSRALTKRRTARWRARHSNASTLPSVSGRDGVASPPIPSQTIPDHTVRAARAKATRFSPDGWLTEQRAEIARVEGLDPAGTFADFRDYWVAKPGASACKLDWDATWAKWCRKDGKEARARAARSAGKFAAHKPAGPSREEIAARDRARLERLESERPAGAPRARPADTPETYETLLRRWTREHQDLAGGASNGSAGPHLAPMPAHVIAAQLEEKRDRSRAAATDAADDD